MLFFVDNTNGLNHWQAQIYVTELSTTELSVTELRIQTVWYTVFWQKGNNEYILLPICFGQKEGHGTTKDLLWNLYLSSKNSRRSWILIKVLIYLETLEQ